MKSGGLDIPELIEWHEGMLLTPQHFQQLSGRTELHTQTMFTLGAPYAWGVIDLRIDPAALGAGMLRILSLEAVMPDGLLALAGIERGILIEDYELKKAGCSPARIYLVLPRDPALYGASTYTRYQGHVVQDGVTLDGVSGADPEGIPRIRPRLKLACGEANLRGMTALPLLEFEMDGAVSKATEYIAPMLRLEAGSALAGFCAPVLKSVRDKATELASRLPGEQTTASSATMRQIQAMVASLPWAEQLLASNQTHPYSLYLALCSMAGNVAMMSNARVPPRLAPYDHNDLLVGFKEVLDFIQLALSEGLIENWERKDFTRSGDKSYFEIAQPLSDAFDADADLAAPDFGLMVLWPAGVSARMMTEWGESCLLGSDETMPYLEEGRSLGGMTKQRVDRLDDLVPGPGWTLFRVSNYEKLIDRHKGLLLKPAQQERSMPAAAALFVRKVPGTLKS